MAKAKLALGLDIGSSAIKIAQLKTVRRRGADVHQLQALGSKVLPPEAIVDGAIMNSTAVVQAIQELVAELRVKHSEAAISLSGHSVIVKKISMPRMSQTELDDAIQAEAEQHIPFEIKDVNLDSFLLPSADERSAQMDVLLVAAKKELINDYTSVVMEAGLRPVVVDVDAFAVQNCFEANYGLPVDETIVLVNTGAAGSSINVLTRGATSLSRDIAIGGNHFTDELQKELNIAYDEAEALKIGGTTTDSDAVVPHEVERVLGSVAEQMTGEIQRSLDYFLSTSAEGQISRIYLSGGSARIPALFKVLEQRTGIPVEVVNPFKKIEVDNRKFDPAFIMEVAPIAAVAVGLGLRRVGDK